MKKVLVIGQGAREHALAWKLGQSPLVGSIQLAPGNHGTALSHCNVAIGVTEADTLAAWAQEEAIDLTIVGPEAALSAGVVDSFKIRGLHIFGPTRAAAQLETSKAWAKRFMSRHGIPTAAYAAYASIDEARHALQVDNQHNDVREDTAPRTYPLVLKSDGLAAGKGVRIVQNQAEALEALRDLQESGATGLVVEAFLEGMEISLLAISDGVQVRPLSPARDYKRAFDGDRGPMTGGMGAFSPVPSFDDTLMQQVMTQIIEPTIAGMAAEGIPYRGVLYAGLMLCANGPHVLEFNARFGDPETQVLLPRWEDDLYVVLEAASEGKLAELGQFRWSNDVACGVVLAAAGYPSSVSNGQQIAGLAQAQAGSLVFHGGTAGDIDGRTVTAGGRLLTVVGCGRNMEEARSKAYQALGQISVADGWCRHDIGL